MALSQLRENKVINSNGSVGKTKCSPDDYSTGGVSIYIKKLYKKSCLFSEIKLDTDLQAVAVSVSQENFDCLQCLSPPITRCKSFIS